MTNSVWIVMEGNWEDMEVIAVFRTEELAEAFAKSDPKLWADGPFPVDPKPPALPPS